MYIGGFEFSMLLPLLSNIIDKNVGLDTDGNQLSRSSKIIKSHLISNVGLVFKPPEMEFFDSIFDSFVCIIADSALENISALYQIPQKFYRILKLDGILTISLPTENITYDLFGNMDDRHLFQTKKQIKSSLGLTKSNFSETVMLDKPLLLLLQMCQKFVMV
jgi:hypothetical protein